MTRKFFYDPHIERVRMVAWTTASHGALAPRPRPLRWVLVALMIVASVLAFDAAAKAGASRITVLR